MVNPVKSVICYGDHTGLKRGHLEDCETSGAVEINEHNVDQISAEQKVNCSHICYARGDD